MCSPACIQFARSHFCVDDIKNKHVLEVGSMDINGSVRMVVESLEPASYLGVDAMEGSGVDELCNVEDLIRRYGKESFEVVIATEMLEHVLNWRVALSNLKNILKPNGVLLLTTRSQGFPYHGFPYDFWRFGIDDMAIILSDLSMEIIERDPEAPGVFVKAHKPEPFHEKNLEGHRLYSIVRHKRCKDINAFDILFVMSRHFLSRSMPKPVKTIIKRLLFLE
jgi:SAM-dependent methyltransferase